jgi:Uncharacterized conserved protein
MENALKKAENFGLTEGISEWILTTKNAAEDQISANAAPIGIIQKNGRMYLRLFKGSKTCENLKRENYCAANITSDAVVYAESTFYDLDEKRFEYKDYRSPMTDAEKIPVLKEADRVVLFKCAGRKETKELLMIEIEPIEFVIQNAEKSGFIANRGFNAVIEACIHMTRYELTKEKAYSDKIYQMREIVLKCGRNRDKEAFEIIMKRLNKSDS